ncbi:hypothetical protein BU26DRAFT_560385 [Trematosphaeria pertusa]|uniref:Secreted protein n=1 Tax=Trematosphaeria pertusa TaxID=390896 RepID=A0A6A6IRF0_9PLEO|nr:uncharacterized protein BU26DRAFT_560385 [Trematosphaeria pertusa]KAF2253041.1 hypothetical protein BU26DRAFT_560385 [Trematosphaeria pertusa]
MRVMTSWQFNLQMTFLVCHIPILACPCMQKYFSFREVLAASLLGASRFSDVQTGFSLDKPTLAWPLGSAIPSRRFCVIITFIHVPIHYRYPLSPAACLRFFCFHHLLQAGFPTNAIDISSSIMNRVLQPPRPAAFPQPYDIENLLILPRDTTGLLRLTGD